MMKLFFMEVAKVEYSPGVDFVAEDTSKNSSSIAKYVTKEITITNPATAVDVHLLANVKNIENIEVLYKYKRASVKKTSKMPNGSTSMTMVYQIL